MKLPCHRLVIHTHTQTIVFCLNCLFSVFTRPCQSSVHQERSIGGKQSRFFLQTGYPHYCQLTMSKQENHPLASSISQSIEMYRTVIFSIRLNTNIWHFSLAEYEYKYKFWTQTAFSLHFVTFNHLKKLLTLLHFSTLLYNFRTILLLLSILCTM